MRGERTLIACESAEAAWALMALASVLVTDPVPPVAELALTRLDRVLSADVRALTRLLTVSARTLNAASAADTAWLKADRP